MSTIRAASDLGVISPKPTVEKTVTVKYKASVRVIGWVKLTADVRSITKYVEAKMSRKKGNASPSTPAAFTAGKGEPIMFSAATP